MRAPTPPLDVYKVAQTNNLQHDGLQSSTGKGLMGKVAQTLELTALLAFVIWACPQSLKMFAWSFIFSMLRRK
jgi:hypothetical protein